MRITWELTAFADYEEWLTIDKKKRQRIYKLILDIVRNGCDKGEGNPEALKGDMSGFYSRRIDNYNRLVYYMSDSDTVVITCCKGHYDKR